MGDGPSVSSPSGAVGVAVPEECVGAFVAEVFEDPERSTRWADAVDALVAPSAREDWEALTSEEQVKEVLATAAEYDDRAIELLSDVQTAAGSRESAREAYDEARRVRRNADSLRDAIADAFAEGAVTEDELVAAVESAGFDTAQVAERERLLERTAETHGFGFRPYGGTLLERSADRDDDPRGETW